MDGLLGRRRQLAEGLLGLYSEPPVDPSPGANPLFQQIFADYQPPQRDVIGNISSGLRRAFDPAEWQRQVQSLGQWPDPRSVMSKGILGSAEDIFNMMTNIAPLGMLVYHGSPHKWAPETGFPQGRPRLDKVGTGEGAQAYGHGWYAAQSPGVAKSYAEAGGARPKLILGGADVPYPGWDAGLGPKEQAMRFIADTVQEKGVDTAAALKMARDRLTAPNQFFDKARLDALTSALDDIEKQGLEVLPSGFVKSLDLPDEKLPYLLDWDKTLTEQTPEVQERLKTLLAYYRNKGASDESLNALRGEHLLDRAGFAASRMGINTPDRLQAASEFLDAYGIPGLRYLDAGSRSGSGGTSNFVVWDQGLLNEMARRPPFAPIPDELPSWAPAERMAQWRTARANAALPVEQGGLGLGPANTAAERAKAGGV